MGILRSLSKYHSGKTFLFKLLDFVEMSAKDFVLVLGGGSLSQEFSKDLMQCGLLLADDIAHDLPLDIKNMSDEFTCRVMYRGQIRHPLKMLLMTSTHDSVLSTVGEELKNRVLKISLDNKYTFNDSKLRAKNSEYYEAQTKLYVQGLVVDAINREVTESEFRTLQDQYRLSGTNERSEILEDVTKDVRQHIKEVSFKHGGCRYIPKVVGLKNYIRAKVIEGFGEHRGDVTKETADLLHYFVDLNRTTVWVKGKSQSAYKVDLNGVQND